CVVVPAREAAAVKAEDVSVDQVRTKLGVLGGDGIGATVARLASPFADDDLPAPPLPVPGRRRHLLVGGWRADHVELHVTPRASMPQMEQAVGPCSSKSQIDDVRSGASRTAAAGVRMSLPGLRITAARPEPQQPARWRVEPLACHHRAYGTGAQDD